MKILSTKNIAFSFLLLIAGFFVLRYQNIILHALCSSRVWIHRVNTLKKLDDVVASGYRGVELDVVYNASDDFFDIYHPPALPIPLSLDEYLSSCHATDLSFWLDFKNLSAENMSLSFERLEFLVDKYKLNRSQFLIESMDPEYLSSFYDIGYSTSYYLPPYLYEQSQDDLEQSIRQIQDIHEAFPTSYISFDRHDYLIVKAAFPDVPKLSWGYYSWGFSADARVTPKRSAVSLWTLCIKLYMLFDKHIDVVLVSYNSENGNR